MAVIALLIGSARFRRMLELELRARGHTVLTGGDGHGRPVSPALLNAADLTVTDEEPPSPPTGAPLLVLTADGTDPADLYRMHRPADVPALLERAELLLTLGAERPAETLIVDRASGKAVFRGETLPLTARDFELLACLYDRRGQPVSRAELLREVWQTDFESGTNVVDVYIRYLRTKLDNRYGVRLIENVRGVGYRLGRER